MNLIKDIAGEYTTQKLLKIGGSTAITLPKNVLKKMHYSKSSKDIIYTFLVHEHGKVNNKFLIVTIENNDWVED